MTPQCPSCGTTITLGEVDVKADIARCPHCGIEWKFSTMPGIGDNQALQSIMRKLELGPEPVTSPEGDLATPGEDWADAAAPPAGAWYRDDGMTLEVGATRRSPGTAVFLTIFLTIWFAVTGPMMVLAVSGVLFGLGVISSGQSGPGGLLGSILMLLFATPFAAAGVWLLCGLAMAIGGRVSVTLRGDDLRIFAGIGPLGRTTRLSAIAVRAVRERTITSRTKNGTSTTQRIELEVEGRGPVRFGGGLTDPRRRFIAGALARVLG